MTTLVSLPGFAPMQGVFAEPMPEAGLGSTEMASLERDVATWNTALGRLWVNYGTLSVFARACALGTGISGAIRLQRAIRTSAIDRWLLTASEAQRDAFEAWRSAFFERCDALAELATEGLVASSLAMPEDGIMQMVRQNPSRMARLLGGDSWLSTSSVMLAAVSMVGLEWKFFAGFLRRQMRRTGFLLSVARSWRIRRRLNSSAGRTLITSRHTEALLGVYETLGERGVRGRQADRIVQTALEIGHETSGKPWKGLGRLYDLLVYSGADPKAPSWSTVFDTSMRSAVEYTHVPGREWIVRDFQIGKRLMQMDGVVAPGETRAGLQQGRGSLATGYLRAGEGRIEFGRRYSKPLAAFLDSMVTAEGAAHQRQRKAFLPFFTQSEVLAHAEFVEQTATSLLDEASAVARRSKGMFDIRKDFAYRFPIRVVCYMLGFPDRDVPNVQRWAEASVRAMDTEAGLTMAISVEGQDASQRLRDYLEDKLNLARAGRFSGRVIRTVAGDATLSEAERVANLGVIIFAGFETTTGLLSKGVEALLRHPEQWSYLQKHLATGAPCLVDGVLVSDLQWRWLAWARTRPAREVDHERQMVLESMLEKSSVALERFGAIAAQECMLDKAIEELLRWTATGTVVPLTASKDITLPLESPAVVRGCPYAVGSTLTVKKGETVAVAVDELNRRCPVGAGRFDAGSAAVLDVTRSDNTHHLSFGLRHSCIGAFLAKENAKRALEGLLLRFPDMELAGEPIPQEMELFSGLASLPVRTHGLGAEQGAIAMHQSSDANTVKRSISVR